jgi:hypothetical protein
MDDMASVRCFTTLEVAKLVNASESRIMQEIAAGRLRARHFARRDLITAADLWSWLDSLPPSYLCPEGPAA